MTKTELRNEIKRRLAELSDETLGRKSHAIETALASHHKIAEANVIAAYAPLKDEPDIFGILTVLNATHTVLLPVISGSEMEFRPINPDIDTIGKYGIREPVEGYVANVSDIDVMIVPGRAFTSNGMRCGRGKGYYDRYMARPGFRAYTIGICFEEQITDTIPTEEFDRAVDYIIKA